MSAPVLALAKAKRRTVAIRLADPAVAVTYLSVAFGLLVVFFPVSFPRIILRNWQSGRLTLAMIVFTVLLDAVLYLRIAHLLSAKPGFIAAASLGALPVIVVMGLSLVAQAAIAHTLLGYVSNVHARVSEEILANTYFGVVAAVFLPFLVIRLLQPHHRGKSLPGATDCPPAVTGPNPI